MGELDAIFEEGVIIWVGGLLDLGTRLLEIDDDHLAKPVKMGHKPGKLAKKYYIWLEKDIETVDFSGWPIFTRIDAPELLIRKVCEAMVARKDSIPWNWGPVKQKELPLESMLVESPETPVDIPFNPVAEEFWREAGYLK